MTKSTRVRKVKKDMDLCPTCWKPYTYDEMIKIMQRQGMNSVANAFTALYKIKALPKKKRG